MGADTTSIPCSFVCAVVCAYVVCAFPPPLARPVNGARCERMPPVPGRDLCDRRVRNVRALRQRRQIQRDGRWQLQRVSRGLVHVGRRRHDTHSLRCVPGGVLVRRHERENPVRCGQVF